VRLSGALAAFFVLPMLAFAAWSYDRLREDARQDGDLLIARHCATRPRLRGR